MCASTITRGPVLPCVAMIDPRPSKVSEDDRGFIRPTSTLRIGSSKPGGPGVSVSCCRSATVVSWPPLRSCAVTAAAPAATVLMTMSVRVAFMRRSLPWQVDRFQSRRHDAVRIPRCFRFAHATPPGRLLSSRVRIARRFLVSGHVQGVGFRWFAENQAAREGLHGWVRNLPDGRVEAAAEGDAEALERFERALRHGPPAARVDDVE